MIQRAPSWGVLIFHVFPSNLPAMREKMPTMETPDQRLDRFAEKLERELEVAKALVKRREDGESIPDFDIRGKLYELALDLAPDAREGDIRAMHDFIKPEKGKRSVDIAAGTGFLTKPVLEWTKAETIAVDPSREQLEMLDRYCGGKAERVLGSPDDASILQNIPAGKIDFVTSFGGLHHVPDQSAMFENAGRMLKDGGRFVAADVCADTVLSRHFDEYVSEKCITGHIAQWLSEERLKKLSKGAGLSLSQFEMKSLTWVFNSEREMALFFKGLHAYDLPEEEIIHDLKQALGTEEKDGKIYLNWPMIFFELSKDVK
ncbi:class I SAM-dependent methyltransferase [Candidatus Uhrbacteria bacterium]|nr:class I SAM-dependent methyltransferase [Candidatus Uhrbacteria bacterium]